jgi:hypothetical protein
MIHGFGYFIGGAGALMLKASVYREETKKYTIITWVLIIVGFSLASI